MAIDPSLKVNQRQDPKILTAADAIEEAASVVNDKFNIALAYSDDAYATALQFLDSLSTLGYDLQPINTDVSFDETQLELEQFVSQKPTAPDISFATIVEPIEPVVEDVTIDPFSSIPGFDVEPLALAFPDRPVATLPADPGSAPAIANVDVPTSPDYDLPVLPTFDQIPFPDSPDIAIPAFDATVPIDDINIPTNLFTYGENAYTSALLTAVQVKLLDDIQNGGDGLDPAVEAAILAREEERALLELEESKDRVGSEWADIPGVGLPDGVLVTEILQINTEYQNSRLTTSRDIAIKSEELSHKNTLAAIENAVRNEGQLLDYTGKLAQRTLDAAIALRDASIATFNAEVARYKARYEGYAAQASAYESRVRGQLAIAEVYKTEIEAVKGKVAINMNYVELYRAQISGITTLIELYKTEVAAASTRLENDRLRLEAFKGEIDIFTAKVGAKTAEFNMYESAVRGELAKAETYRAQVTAFAARVDAMKSEATLLFEKARIESDLEKTKVQIYSENITAYKAKVDAESVRVNALVEVYKGETDAYRTDGQIVIGMNEAQVSLMNARITQARASAELRIKEADIQIRQYHDLSLLKAETVKAGALVASQIAASSLSSINASAHLSGGGTFTESMSESHYEDHTPA